MKPDLAISLLSSGSKGNAAILRAGGRNILIDAGIPPKAIPGLGDIEDILITHEHHDHAGYLPNVCKAIRRHRPTVYMTAGTAKHLNWDGRFARVRIIEPDEPFELGSGLLQVLPVAVPHDAGGPVGYIATDGETTAGIVVDLGHIPDELAGTLSEVDDLVLDANYDVDMIRASQYHHKLRARILSELGHLSNDDVCRWVTECGGPRRSLTLAHMSAANNDPELALEMVRGSLGCVQGLQVSVWGRTEEINQEGG